MHGLGRSDTTARTRPLRAPHQARRLARRLAHDTLAVSPVVGTIMILAISAFGLGVVMTWGLPSMEQTKADAEFEALFDQFHSVEEIVQNVMRSGSTGKASYASLSFTEGELQRTKGPLFVFSTHHATTSANDAHRYRITVTDAEDPIILEVEAVGGANITGRFVDAHTIDPDNEVLLQSTSNWVSNKIELSLDRDDIGDGSLRVRVMHEAKPAVGEPEPFPLMQAWFIQVGALEYTRHAPYGETSIILEMGSIVTEFESGNHVHTDPLVRRELDDQDETRFLSVFAPSMSGGPNANAVESSGPGSHPIRFLLTLNMLHIPGIDAVGTDLHIVHPHADIWYEHFEERHGYTRVTDAGTGEVERAVIETPASGSFEFALMESRIEIEMQQGVTRIDT